MYAGVDSRFRPAQVDEATRARLRARLGTQDAFLMYVGAADPRKNVGLIIEALALMAPEARSRLGIVFVGALSESERNFVREATRRASVPDDKVVLLGLVDEADLVALYRMCEALVFPSTNEGFGLPPLEAMACGVPALVAKATSLPEVVDRADCQFDPHDAAALAKTLGRLSSEPDWRRDLCAWGPRRAREFTWRAAGRRVLDAFEAVRPARRETIVPTSAPAHRAKPDFRRRPRMAFVSPLPPDRSGIADYSAELLRELLNFYEIDCFHPEAETSDPWIAANCRLQDFTWFDEHAHLYDRILYSIGNSTFHEHMFSRLARHPGVVILHDAFLSDLAVYKLRGAETPSDAFLREVYESHGLSGLRHLLDHGRNAVIADLTMTGSVFRNADGVILHSHYASRLAEKVFGDEIASAIAVVPHLRGAAPIGLRAAAREALGFDDADFVICCFGMVHERKMNREVAEAFASSTLADDRRCCLAFVGEAEPVYGATIEAFVTETAPDANVRFVGRADAELYNRYLQAADVAVQLRTESRGETSGATLDAMAHGLAVVVSDIGAASEIADDAVLKVPTDVTAAALAAHLVRLHDDPDYRRGLADRARREIGDRYHPETVGRSIHELIEGFAASPRRAEERALLAAIGDIRTAKPIEADDLDWVAAQTETLLPVARLRQIFYDVSAIARTDLRTGIERVVRAVLERLILAPPPGYRVEPTIIANGTPVYAREFVEKRLGLAMGGLPPTPVKTGAGDRFLAVDWAPDQMPEIEPWLGRFRRSGGLVTFVVHDILPLETPSFFPDWLYDVDKTWLDMIIRNADNIACVSRVVADSVASFGEPSARARSEPLSIGFFHHGSDLAASQPTTGLPDDAEILLARLRERPTFLILGTVEPRKGHNQLMAAFESLWDHGLDVGLVIVGKEGWMVDETAAAIRGSRMAGSKLTWLPRASDEMLGKVFEASVALIVASFGEGFGLPLIEAARQGLPLIARDLPIFREVAGDHAFYFAGSEPAALTDAIRRWLALREQGKAPSSSGIERLSWAQATDQLLDIMFGERHYRTLPANIGAPSAQVATR